MKFATIILILSLVLMSVTIFTPDNEQKQFNKDFTAFVKSEKQSSPTAVESVATVNSIIKKYSNYKELLNNYLSANPGCIAGCLANYMTCLGQGSGSIWWEYCTRTKDMCIANCPPIED